MIIGITGKTASGKGAVVEFFKNRGFNHLSVSVYLREELARQQKPETIENMANLGNELRKSHQSPSYIVEQLYNQALEIGGNHVIESLRVPGEVDFLRNNSNFLLISVNAALPVRYQRYYPREISKGKTPLKYFEFEAAELKQIKSRNPFEQNIATCMKKADVEIFNNDSLEMLHRQLTKLCTVFNIEGTPLNKERKY